MDCGIMRKLTRPIYLNGRLLITSADLRNEIEELKEELWDIKHPRDAQGNFTTGENEMWRMKWGAKYGLSR